MTTKRTFYDDEGDIEILAWTPPSGDWGPGAIYIRKTEGLQIGTLSWQTLDDIKCDDNEYDEEQVEEPATQT